MNGHKRWLAVLTVVLASFTGSATAADIRLNNLDAGTRQGLDDPTPAAPIGGNPGRTRGEQARIVFQYAASLWGAVLKSRVPIDIDASFKKLTCTKANGLLGSAGPNGVIFFKPGRAPYGVRANTVYHSALANALIGLDVYPGSADVTANFNGAMGTPGCLEDLSWYFGLDTQEPKNQTNFLKVVMHELAHGLGFLGFNDLTTGTLPFDDADGTVLSDMYSSYVYDNATGKRWNEMTDAERLGAVVDDGHLVFTGPHVKAHAPAAVGRRKALVITAPASAAGEYPYYWATKVVDFRGAVVRAVNGTNAEACSALDNAIDVAGQVVMLDFGASCNLDTKLRFAHAAGAVGAIVVDDRAAPPSARTGGSDAGTIPAIVISKGVGDVFKANLAGLLMEIRTLPTGTDGAGNVLLYAPKTIAPASSFAHFDARVQPVPLMEPSDTRRGKAVFDLDLTPSVFMDEGWGVNTGGQLLGLCDTGVPTWLPGGPIVGANLAAQAKMLASTLAVQSDYAAGIRAHAATLARTGLLSAAQTSSLNACLTDAEVARQYDSWRQGGIGAPAFIELDSGRALQGLAGAASSERLFLLTVPPGARALNIRSFGGTGDVSLVVKVGNEPTATNYSYLSAHAGNSESVVVARPAAGSYFIKLVGIRPYASVSVQATYSM